MIPMVPSQEEIASASVDLSIDYSFAANMPRVMRQGDTRRLIYESAGDFIKEKMELTDFESVIALAEAASREAAGYREEKLNRWEAQISLNEVSMSVTIIAVRCLSHICHWRSRWSNLCFCGWQRGR